MSYLNMESIWRILKVNKIEADALDISDFICVICKNITIKPHNVPCGCRYCFDCITSYLNDEEKFCLGESDCCKDVLINMRENVFVDQAANRRICNLKVKCPIESCEFRHELSKIEEHMGSCDLKPTNCPYQAIGCNKEKIGSNKLKEHFTEESYCHAKLLMEMVDNWGNELKLMKAALQESQHENKLLGEEIKLMKQNNESREENVALLKTEIEDLKKKGDKDKKHWDLLVSIFDEEWKLIKTSQAQISTRLGEISHPTIGLYNVSNEKTTSPPMPVQPHRNLAPFLWFVTNWNNTLKRAQNGTDPIIWSEPFYTSSSGYKMCLEMHPNGSGMFKGVSLFLGICIMKGDHDDWLPWPFTHDVKLDLLNQDTGQAHVTKTVKYSQNGHPWDKPTNGKNKQTGFRNFLELIKISSNDALCRGDTVLVQASVQMK